MEAEMKERPAEVSGLFGRDSTAVDDVIGWAVDGSAGDGERRRR